MDHCKDNHHPRSLTLNHSDPDNRNYRIPGFLTYGVSGGHAHGPGAGDQVAGLQEAETVIKPLFTVPGQSEGYISDQSEGLLGEDVGAGREHDVDHPGHVGGAHLYRGVAETDLR